MNKTYVGIVGSSSPPPEVSALAEQVGRAAGELGATVICGGRSGVMEAA
ncbi:MAG TPA: TIGR00725 family protein, partial [Firmicutes bacterium]|nr:TIGR00725 family protein [Bacillota bacterium]